ncbi:MAG: hypothetical protein JNJ60_23325 [Rhodocyclaceae bacterium]|nr:hypothetical protein [Rhodocyclaceae bacterium]
MKHLLSVLLMGAAASLAVAQNAPGETMFPHSERDAMRREIDDLQQRAAQMRRAADDLQQREIADCWKKVLVSACQDKARKTHIESVAKAREVELQARERERELRTRLRDARRADAAAARARAAERAHQSANLPLPPADVQSPDKASRPQRPAGDAAAERAAHEADRQRERAQAESAAQERAERAASRREEYERKRQKRDREREREAAAESRSAPPAGQKDLPAGAAH